MGIKNVDGIRIFYSNAEWRERGERYGRNADLIVVHPETDIFRAFRSAISELERKRFHAEQAEELRYSVVLNQPLSEKK